MIIFRYLTKEIVTTMLATTLILLVLFVTNQSVQFLQRAASGTLPATEVLQVIMLQIPLLLGYLLPLGLYFGVLLTLGRLYLDSEMTVLCACGMSRAKLTGIVFLVALFVASVVAWLMAEVVPIAQRDINIISNNAIVTASVQEVIPNRFMILGSKQGTPITFYATDVQNHKVLHHVFMARSSVSDHKNVNRQWDVIIANSAAEENNRENGRYLVFNNGYRYSGIPGEGKYRRMQFDHYAMRLSTSTISHLNAVQFYSMSKLWSQRHKHINAAAELQWRISLPISTIIFALLAVPLSEVRPRFGKFSQLIPALLIYVTYADLIFLARTWIQSGHLSPQVGMWWIHSGALGLAILLMLYRVGWRRLWHPFSRNKII